MSKTKGRRLAAARHIPGLTVCSVWVIVTFVILIYVAVASTRTSRDIFQGTVFQFEGEYGWGDWWEQAKTNYETAWKVQELYKFFLNSIIYAIFAVAGGVGMAAPAAYVLSRYRFTGNGLIKRALVLAMSIPSILMILPLYALFVEYDIQGRVALTVVYACKRVPYSTIYLLNFFETISKSYEEAAAIDGCPSSKIFLKIMLPMVRPAITTICLFGFLGVLNEYMICLLLIPASNTEAMSLGVGLSRAINALKYQGNYPAMYAAVVIAVVPSILIYAFTSRKIIFGGMGGGVKG